MGQTCVSFTHVGIKDRVTYIDTENKLLVTKGEVGEE